MLNPNCLAGGNILPLDDPERPVWFFWSLTLFTLVNQNQVLVTGKWSELAFLKSAGGGSVLQIVPESLDCTEQGPQHPIKYDGTL